MSSPYYEKSPREALAAQQSTLTGLSQEEAASRAAKFGENKLTEGKKKSVFVVFLEQFRDLLVVILMAAAVISALSKNVESTIVIFAVLILNAVLGTVQYVKAEKSLESLKAMSAPTAKVLRDGVRVEIPSYAVVPGDIVLLEAGDMVVADGRVLENFSLKVNESSLTGESEAVEKDVDALSGGKIALGDQKNMVFSGSLVTYGRATVLVTATGMDTELGKIAALMNETKQRKTPLQQSLDSFSAKLATVILVICAVVFALSIFRTGMGILDSLMFAVALAVAAIPEALSSIVTIVLAVGTKKMARENAIMKELKAVESLGAVSVICSDKTGTLTQNKMTPQKIYADGALLEGKDLQLANNVQRQLLKSALLASDATNDEVHGTSIGDPTEVALVMLGEQFGVVEEDYRAQHPRLSELAFDSDRKLMSTLHDIEGVPTLYTKGAIDVLLDRSSRLLTSQGAVALTAEKKAEILAVNQSLSEAGLRVLAFAEKALDSVRPLTLDDEQDLTFIGLISMIDPPRPEAVAAVADAKTGGIRTIMITGDHKVTATAIARQLGIFQEGDEALSGVELDQLDDAALDENVEHIAVYARVSPENKIRIVKAWQRKGQVVSMTGDGVNDAPAVKTADIGVAMGITGTEVTKESAKMILADDNFSTIVAAVREGRGIFDNIRKFLRYLLSSNVGEVFTVFGGVMLAGVLGITQPESTGVTLPLLATQLLWINLLTDAAPALAMGVDPQTEDVMNRKPRKLTDHVIDRDMWIDIAFIGIIMAAVTLIGMDMHLAGGLFTDRSVDALGHEAQLTEARTMGFTILVFAQLFNAIASRSSRQSAFVGLFSNKWLWGAIGLSVVLQLLVIYVPFLNGPFGTTPLSPLAWVECICLAAFVLIASEIYKAIMRAIDKARGKELSH